MEMDETQAWSSVDKISDEIENGDIKQCSEHGWFKEEKQRLIAIKDSLKDVDNMLVLLQRLQSRQRQQCQEAFIKLENSRMHLMANNIKHFQQHEQGLGAQLDVIGELNALFSNDDNNLLKVEGGSCWPVFINCFRGLFQSMELAHNCNKNSSYFCFCFIHMISYANLGRKTNVYHL